MRGSIFTCQSALGKLIGRARWEGFGYYHGAVFAEHLLKMGLVRNFIDLYSLLTLWAVFSSFPWAALFSRGWFRASTGVAAISDRTEGDRTGERPPSGVVGSFWARWETFSRRSANASLAFGANWAQVKT